MVLQSRDDKDAKINVLMNIDNYFGEHQGRMGPMLMFISLLLVPPVLYVVFFLKIIPIWVFLVFEVLFGIRVGLKTLGREDEKLRVYKAAAEDAYANADDVVSVASVQEDGLIDYENGMIAYVISAFTTTYFDENKLVQDMAQFLEQLNPYVYHIHSHMVYKEELLQDGLTDLTIYKDTELLQERLDFYDYQDEYCDNYTEMFRINFVVVAPRYDWKKLRSKLEVLVKSSKASVFKKCVLCNKEQVNNVMSRDLLVYVDLASMLQKKYKNSEYYGSKVYYYGEEVQEDVPTGPEYDGRRVVEEQQEV